MENTASDEKDDTTEPDNQEPTESDFLGWDTETISRFIWTGFLSEDKAQLFWVQGGRG